MLERLPALMTSGHGPKIFAASLVLVLGTTAGVVVNAATDGGNGDNNAAVAVNTTDDKEKFKLSFKVTRTNADTVDPANAAVAYSSCTNCETIALAVQVVIAWDDPSIVSPTNLAIAVNENCQLCVTYADARQYVVTTDGVNHFSADGNRRIADIRGQLKDLKKQDLTVEELNSRIDALSAELAQLIADEFLTFSGAATMSPSPTASPDQASQTAPSSTATSDSSPTPTATDGSPTPTAEEATTPTQEPTSSDQATPTPTP